MTGVYTTNWSTAAGAIGVILPSAIGDSLASLPAVAWVAEHFHEHPKVVVCVESSLVMFEQLVLPNTRFIANKKRFLDNHRGLDCLFDFGGSAESATVIEWLKPRWLFRHTFTGASDGFHYEGNGVKISAYNAMSVLDAQTHKDDLAWARDAGLVAAALNLELPTASSLRTIFDRFTRWQDWPTPPLAGPVTLAPGGAVGKKWPAKNWCLLGARLVEQRFELRVALGPDDVDPLPSEIPHYVLTCLPLDELSRRFQESACVIANDCGTMHLAAVFGCRVLGLFGPTNEKVWFPYNGPGQFPIRSAMKYSKPNGVRPRKVEFLDWPSPTTVMHNLLEILRQR